MPVGNHTHDPRLQRLRRGSPDLLQRPARHAHSHRRRGGSPGRRPDFGRGSTGDALVNGITSSTALWYASRATGVVALLLLTAVIVLGILVNRQGRLPGLPRFGATSLHRSVSLLAAVFVAVHVATAIADPFVSIGIVASVVPFVSHYEAFWLGLGAV